MTIQSKFDLDQWVWYRSGTDTYQNGKVVEIQVRFDHNRKEPSASYKLDGRSGFFVESILYASRAEALDEKQ